MPRKVSAYLPGFRRYMETATGFGPLTMTAYLAAVRTFAGEVGDPTLRDLTPGMLLDWHASLQERGFAQGTVRQRHSGLKAFLTYLADFQEEAPAKRLLEIFRKLKVPNKVEPKRVPYSLERKTLRTLIDAAGHRYGSLGLRDKALVHMLVATGMRRAEVAGLLIGKVDIQERTAVITGKGMKERTVIFDDDCRQDLVAWLEARRTWPVGGGINHVFITVTGGPMTPRAAWAVLRGAVKRAGIRKPVYTHLLRHSFVTGLLDERVPVHIVSQLVGHADTKTTMGYTHTRPETMKREYDRAMKRRSWGAKKPPEAEGPPEGEDEAPL